MESTENTSSGEKEYKVSGYDKKEGDIKHTIITKESGKIGGIDNNKYRMTFHENDNPISPWHDIPLKTGKEDIYNFICEIPKYTKPKMEINTKENFNPIEQDIKKGKPREYHGPIYWNYGCLPQTWENPDIIDKELHKGDNDPLDVVEIGDKPMKIGEIAPVKVLGILAMIDEGEVDWKVIAIRPDAKVTIGKDNNGENITKLANDINEIDQVPKEVLSGIREWFRWYKTPDSKPPDDVKPLNEFGLNEEFQDKNFAIKIINDTNKEYENIFTLKYNINSEKAKDLNLTSVRYGKLDGGMRKRRTSRRTKRKRKSLNKNKRTKRKRKRNTSNKSRRTRTRTRRH